MTVPAGAASPAETTEIMAAERDQRILQRGGPEPSEGSCMSNMSAGGTRNQLWLRTEATRGRQSSQNQLWLRGEATQMWSNRRVFIQRLCYVT